MKKVNFVAILLPLIVGSSAMAFDGFSQEFESVGRGWKSHVAQYNARHEIYIQALPFERHCLQQLGNSKWSVLSETVVQVGNQWACTSKLRFECLVD